MLAWFSGPCSRYRNVEERAALLDWPATDRGAAMIGVATIRRFKAARPIRGRRLSDDPKTAQQATGIDLGDENGERGGSAQAIEENGRRFEFIDENGGGAGCPLAQATKEERSERGTLQRTRMRRCISIRRRSARRASVACNGLFAGAILRGWLAGCGAIIYACRFAALDPADRCHRRDRRSNSPAWLRYVEVEAELHKA